MDEIEMKEQEARDIHQMLMIQKREWVKLMMEAVLFILTVVGVSIAFDRRVSNVEGLVLSQQRKIDTMENLLNRLSENQASVIANQAVAMKLLELMEKRHQMEDKEFYGPHK